MAVAGIYSYEMSEGGCFLLGLLVGLDIFCGWGANEASSSSCYGKILLWFDYLGLSSFYFESISIQLDSSFLMTESGSILDFSMEDLSTHYEESSLFRGMWWLPKVTAMGS